ncbi:MAG: hypothetical protein RQ760_05200, partial [Sedimentisphaerales bacterium]|nr:hypothetical protein [Sedimentisphaerales bacterium]
VAVRGAGTREDIGGIRVVVQQRTPGVAVRPGTDVVGRPLPIVILGIHYVGKPDGLLVRHARNAAGLFTYDIKSGH